MGTMVTDPSGRQAEDWRHISFYLRNFFLVFLPGRSISQKVLDVARFQIPAQA